MKINGQLKISKIKCDGIDGGKCTTQPNQVSLQLSATIQAGLSMIQAVHLGTPNHLCQKEKRIKKKKKKQHSQFGILE